MSRVQEAIAVLKSAALPPDLAGKAMGILFNLEHPLREQLANLIMHTEGSPLQQAAMTEFLSQIVQGEILSLLCQEIRT